MVKLDIDPTKNFQGYNYLQVQEDFDVIKQLRMGGYASSLITVDTLARSATLKTFGYNDVDDNALIGLSPPVKNLHNRFGFPLANSISSMIKMVPADDMDMTVNPHRINTWMPQQIARLGQLHSYKMMMSIPGDVLVKAGMVVTVDIPLMHPTDKQGVQLDPVRSGNYLVSAVHHHFELDIMATVVELLSDSTNVDLDEAANSDQNVQKLVNW